MMLDYEKLSSLLGIELKEKSFYLEAFTHKSYSKSNPSESHNERLEFLGDAVLKIIVSEDLFDRFKNKQEGELSKMRAHIVSDRHLATLSTALGLGEFLRLSFGEDRAGGRDRSSNLANVFESLLGAIYLDHGFEPVRNFFKTVMREYGSDFLKEFSSQDYKSTLQEHMQKLKARLPEYETIGSEGPEHQKEFFVRAEVEIKGLVYDATGSGRSKKEAEQSAAKLLVVELGLTQPVFGSD